MTSRRLSHREHEVLARYLRHPSQKQVALDMDISQDTVNKHLQSAYRKLRATSAIEAAARLGWLRVPPPITSRHSLTRE